MLASPVLRTAVELWSDAKLARLIDAATDILADAAQPVPDLGHTRDTIMNVREARRAMQHEHVRRHGALRLP